MAQHWLRWTTSPTYLETMIEASVRNGWEVVRKYTRDLPGDNPTRHCVLLKRETVN